MDHKYIKCDARDYTGMDQVRIQWRDPVQRVLKPLFPQQENYFLTS